MFIQMGIYTLNNNLEEKLWQLHHQLYCYQMISWKVHQKRLLTFCCKTRKGSLKCLNLLMFSILQHLCILYSNNNASIRNFLEILVSTAQAYTLEIEELNKKLLERDITIKKMNANLVKFMSNMAEFSSN